MSQCRPQFLVIWNLAQDGAFLSVDGSTNGTTWDPGLFTFGGANGPNWLWVNGFLNPPYDNQASVYLRWRLATGSQTADGVYVDEVVVRCRRVSYAAGNEFANPSGTSMASPHVAGAAALAFAKIPGASVAAVKHAILEGVDPKPTLSGLVATGGRLNLNGMLTRLTAGYPRSKGATPLRVPLIPAYTQCTSPNREHGPPDLPGGTESATDPATRPRSFLRS